MKNCIGVSPKAYTTDPEGRRLCPTPFLHYPDFCPYWKEANKEGDCYKNCDEISSAERPCYRAAFKLDEEEKASPAVQTVEAQIAEEEESPETPDKEEGTDKPFVPEGYYWCYKCKHAHDPKSGIGQKHQKYDKPDEEAEAAAPSPETYREEIRTQVEQGGWEVLEKQAEILNKDIERLRQTIRVMKEKNITKVGIDGEDKKSGVLLK